ncbi:MAG TPA: helix-turn-helix domain-containing protein [Leptospiraceae bacterium]|nr:helix-turn-helix domain-containing protein [Leptospiraceae bacterium]HMY29804.1 helix-turn-helix domain-containing protein [Leptospiraceae bacterium]HNF53405.1 helix-turn-helix domain-containing protein [Leptospiraceae bacterium]HNI89481.1 helix-turn-helix domain-containing protein [Leptospiraceae bacterium]HNK55127.1 helix-turn-helix domain-containing protein [Leptospiraceae bacterium]
MSEFNNQYIKFMSDIIDSGLWGRLSPAAKTLYPVLLKFSDQNFKQVWPGTDLLLKLTGFKTKKSIVLGKKELIKEGLLYYRPGSGRTNSVYYFTFNYPGSKIIPQRDKTIPLTGIQTSPREDDALTPQTVPSGIPNHLNITITNTQSLKTDKEESYEKLIDMYGIKVVDEAYQMAKLKGFETNLSYVAGICKNISRKGKENVFKNNQEMDTAQHVIDSWRSFIDWSKMHLTRSSVDILKQISISVDGRSIYIQEDLSDFLKQIIIKYFHEELDPPILVVFSSKTSRNY